ncbi:MAG: haloacid dehalogenase type II [Gammaproteobacteria bacterium]|jgi:2-haloacid dehalogenase
MNNLSVIPSVRHSQWVLSRRAIVAGAVSVGTGAVAAALSSSSRGQDSSDSRRDIKALTFDVFGTVVDWYTSVVREGRLLGARKGIDVDWGSFAAQWRAGYGPAMARVRSGDLPYMNIDELHRLILTGLLREFGIRGLSDSEIDDFNRVWHRLIPWPDAVQGLYRLKSRYVIATLSNGNVSLLTNMAKHAGLPWDVILSSELTPGYFKIDRQVYEHAADLLDLEPSQIMMVAAHKNDLSGARAVGFRTAFVQRPLEQGPEGEKDTSPDPEADVNVADLSDLARQLGT